MMQSTFIKTFLVLALITGFSLAMPTVGAVDDPDAYPGHLIKKGSRGEDVEHVQWMINDIAYVIGGPTQQPFLVDVDSIFGKKTEKAVNDFQKENYVPETDEKLVVDGIVGRKTWNSLVYKRNQAISECEKYNKNKKPKQPRAVLPSQGSQERC